MDKWWNPLLPTCKTARLFIYRTFAFSVTQPTFREKLLYSPPSKTMSASVLQTRWAQNLVGNKNLCDELQTILQVATAAEHRSETSPAQRRRFGHHFIKEWYELELEGGVGFCQVEHEEKSIKGRGNRKSKDTETKIHREFGELWVDWYTPRPLTFREVQPVGGGGENGVRLWGNKGYSQVCWTLLVIWKPWTVTGEGFQQANVTPNECLKNILLRGINTETAWSYDILAQETIRIWIQQVLIETEVKDKVEKLCSSRLKWPWRPVKVNGRYRGNQDDATVCSWTGKQTAITTWDREYRTKRRFGRDCDEVSLDLLNIKYISNPWVTLYTYSSHPPYIRLICLYLHALIKETLCV